MYKYKIRVSIILILSICLFQYACTKSENTDMKKDASIETEWYNPEQSDNDADPDDPDEIGYAVDIADPEQLEERALAFKIMQVITTDSMPAFRTDGSGKKQKYGKRQIVSTTAKTRFFLRGYGFKPLSDSSRVKAYIKNVEQPSLDIINWSDTLVTVDFPILTSPLLIEKTFSIKFKLFRANEKAGKPNISRSRSKSCISSVQAAATLNGTTTTGNCVPTTETQSRQLATAKLIELGKTFPTSAVATVTASYNPQIGDVLLISAANSALNFDTYGVVISQKNQDNIFTVYCPLLLDNAACSQTAAAYRGCEVKTNNQGVYVVKGLSGFDPNQYYR